MDADHHVIAKRTLWQLGHFHMRIVSPDYLPENYEAPYFRVKDVKKKD